MIVARKITRVRLNKKLPIIKTVLVFIVAQDTQGFSNLRLVSQGLMTHCLSVECAGTAQDPLELEEAHVMQQLTTKYSGEFDILSK